MAPSRGARARNTTTRCAEPTAASCFAASAGERTIVPTPPISYLGTLIKTKTESIGSTLRRRRILFAGFVARTKDARLSKCVMSGELVGGTGCVRGKEKEWMGCFLDDLRAFGINTDQ